MATPAQRQTQNNQPQSFSYKNPESPSDKRKTQAYTITILIILIFFAFLLICLTNYFNLINIPFLPKKPLFNNLFIAPNLQNLNAEYDAKTNAWKTSGTLYQYSSNVVRIKVEEKIIDFIFLPQQSSFLLKSSTFSDDTIPKLITQTSPRTLIDLMQDKNLNKKAEVYFIKDKSGKNIIQTLILTD